MFYAYQVDQTNRGIRVLTVLLSVTVAVIVLFLRMVDLQVAQGKEFFELAEENRHFTKRVIASRGILLDRFGTALVMNKPVYYRLDNPTQLYSSRTRIEGGEALSMLTTQPERIFLDQYREYPYGDAIAPVTGYVGQVTQEELIENPTFHLNQIVGKTGLEYVLNQQLSGKDGTIVYEVNARGELLRIVTQEEAISGESVNTTIDAELTAYVAKLMEGKKGSVIVGDPHTGEVLSLVSAPTFNPNEFTKPTFSAEEEKNQRQKISSYFLDENKLFFNRSLAGGYPPGSIFKLVTAVAGLEAEAIDTETVVQDEGVLKVGEFEYGNWYFRQYGRVEGGISLVRAIARSNDIYFYKAAEWLGPDRLAQSARMFGFGSPTGIELPAEASGIVPDPAWKEKTIGEKWYLGNTYHYGIGQGDVLVTPAQMFQAVSLFANQSKICAPTLLKDAIGRCHQLSISTGSIETVREGMIGACSAGGTGFPFFDWNSKRENKVACKTGTAEFGGAVNAKGYRKTHGWFVATLSLDGEKESSDGISIYPRDVLIVVLVESDDIQPFREGSKDAGPIAFEIVKWLDEKR